MRLHDYTGFEGYSNAELASEALHRYDPLTCSPIELEMAQRIDAVEDHDALLTEYEDALCGYEKDCAAGLLKVLNDRDIDHADQLDEALGLAAVITEFDVTNAELTTILRKHFETQGD